VVVMYVTLDSEGIVRKVYRRVQKYKIWWLGKESKGSYKKNRIFTYLREFFTRKYKLWIGFVFIPDYTLLNVWILQCSWTRFQIQNKLYLFRHIIKQTRRQIILFTVRHRLQLNKFTAACNNILHYIT
jgi:hypothetical protein